MREFPEPGCQQILTGRPANACISMALVFSTDSLITGSASW